MKHTIKRSDLIAAARGAIQRVRHRGVEVTPSLERRVMRVAETAPQISRAWWVGECGCLIGTLHTRAARAEWERAEYADKWVERLPDAQRQIGTAFAFVPELDGLPFELPLTVVEDAA